MKERNRFLFYLIPELIAVFVGVALALLVDSKRTEIKSIEGKRNYFSLVKFDLQSEFEPINDLTGNLDLRIKGIDEIIESFDSVEVFQANLIEETNYYTISKPSLTAVLTSTSFIDIYDTLLFNELTKNLSDRLLLEQNQKDLTREQSFLLNNFIYKSMDSNTSEFVIIDDDSVRVELKNHLIRFRDLLLMRSLALKSLSMGNYKVIERINKITEIS